MAEIDVVLNFSSEQPRHRDVLGSKEKRDFIRKHFSAFIRYLEETDSELKNITSYMKKMEKFLFKILRVTKTTKATSVLKLHFVLFKIIGTCLQSINFTGS